MALTVVGFFKREYLGGGDSKPSIMHQSVEGIDTELASNMVSEYTLGINSGPSLFEKIIELCKGEWDIDEVSNTKL